MDDPATDRLTYASYLHLPELLSLQQPRSRPPEHDETVFIVIHQVSELWFEVLLHELDKIKQDLSDNHLFRVMSSLKRCQRVMAVLVDQLDVLETMTPLSFIRFRDRLDTSSGFQSMQFRELEFVLGLKNAAALDHYPAGLFGRDRAECRLLEPSVPDCLYDFLEQRGVEIPADLRARDVTEPHIPDERVQAGIDALYRADGSYVMLFELMVDFDAELQEWRYRHVKLVERTIGNKAGTGGSLGVEYLKASLFKPVFPDLWAIRHRF